jgi:hypothetical protein
MNTKKDEPGKKDPTGASGPSASRPHATIDLKATEVGPKAPKEPPREEPPKADKPAAAAAPAGTPPRASTGAGAGKPEEQKREPARSVGSSRFFTHLAAGIAGGIVALLGADMLASQLGLSSSPDQAQVSAALQRRIEALETGSKGNGATEKLAARLKTAEAKLGKLEQLRGSVVTLEKNQGALNRDVKSLDAKVGAQSADGSAEARIKKLEDQLAALSEAAARDPNGGGLPQLAAVTGKITDIEATLTNQLDALRKNVTEEIDTRLAASATASEAAKSGTQRIDRELASIKTDNAQLAARLNTLNAEADRASQTLRTTQEELTQLKVDLNARLPTFARPEDVAAATNPLSDKITSLQQDMQSVVKGEADRKTTTSRIVLSLELANLKRAIDRGNGYAAELAATRKLSNDGIDLAPLSRFADSGVPTLAELRQDFKAVAFKVIDADQQPVDGSIVERLLAGAKSVVRVRKVNHESDDKTAEAVVARMETALNEDRLDDVINEAKTLPPAAQDAARDFLAKVEARNAVDRALASVETQLKASLVSPSPGGADPAQE